ncbi:MAG: metalloregulator ArsR/SmtB family transcription factor [Alphaproteobacteria bacterium]|nr:metalloregulator ArsR/SmtB family transcription factor [Alphaproteobacteria bacterium]
MDINHAVVALSALSQETRLRVFKLLIEYGVQGTPAGQLSEQLDIPHNTLSFHLSHLSHAGLVKSRRIGRSIIYTASPDVIETLLSFMVENCCARGKSPECCSPSKKKRAKKL